MNRTKTLRETYFCEFIFFADVDHHRIFLVDKVFCASRIDKLYKS